MRFVIGYIATLLTFWILDFVWLGGIAKGFYQSRIGGLLLAQPNWAAAVLFYLLFATGMHIFCVAPALDAGSIGKAALFGALFGFFCYMTYDLSNLATLKDWSVSLAVVDIAWGTFVGAVASTAGYAATRAIAGSA